MVDSAPDGPFNPYGPFNGEGRPSTQGRLSPGRRLSSERPIRTAVVGYGLAGSVFHAPLVAATDGLALTAVVTGNPERAAAARRRYLDVRVEESVEALLARPGQVDLVVVASPNASHVPVALAAIRAGLHVVVDKPLAPTVAAAGELRDAAAEEGVLVSVFHNRRWDGDALTVRDLLAGGELGTVHRFESRYERWRPERKPDAWRESAAPGTAGGLLYDLGTHLIDQALWLFGPVSTVYAEAGSVRPGAEVDDDVFVALGHVSGVRSHLWASSVASPAGDPNRKAAGVGSAPRSRPGPYPPGPGPIRTITSRCGTRCSGAGPLR